MPSGANPRGPSSLLELAMDWDHPVYVAPAVVDDGRTIAGEVRRSLPLAQALAYIAKDDPRPLLVLRDCFRCSGTDDALMTKKADNEKTMLMSRWFHCVRLPPDVLQKDHPFNALFPGEKPAHLFVSQSDGSGRASLGNRAIRCAHHGDQPGAQCGEPHAAQGLHGRVSFDRTSGRECL